MRATTPTKMRSESEKIYNYVCTHKPAKIVSTTRPDIIMVLATDYEDIKIELDNLKTHLQNLSADDEHLIKVI